jgi:predicted transcriptional regulator
MDLSILQAMKVKDVMSKDLITADCETTMFEAEELLKKHNIHHLIVVDQSGFLKGIISQKDIDILKDWTMTFNSEKAQSNHRNVLKSQYVSDCLEKNVVSINSDETLSYCADIILENYFHALPVVKEGKPIGIITSFDLINSAFGRK